MHIPRIKKIDKSEQSGIVAIIVTVMLMLVITLIVLTFSKIIRREQRQALDRQLNTQAFYAAESGVNDALKALKDDPTIEKKKCNDPSEGPNIGGLASNTIINAANNVSYSCLTVTPDSLGTLIYLAPVNKSISVPVNSSGAELDTISVTWENGNGNFNCNALMGDDTNFPASPDIPANCGTGVLRLDIVPTPPTGLDRATLIAKNRTVFMIPTSGIAGSTGFTYSTATSGDKVGIACASNDCTAVINLPTTPADASKNYYLHLRSIYHPSSIKISATAGGTAVRLNGAQALIDSTGKANDVLRRIQVRVPLDKSVNVPGFAIQSTDTICKRLKVTGASVIFDNPNILGVNVDSCNIGTVLTPTPITPTPTPTPTTPTPGSDEECVDGIDNDGDGDTDYPADSGCIDGTDDEA